MKRRFVTAGALAMLAIGVCRADDSSADPDCRLVDIPKCQIHVVERAQLAAERDGILELLPIKVGDYVEKGALLVELRDEIAETSLALFEARAGNDVNVRYSEAVLKAAQLEYETAMDLKRQKALTEQLFRQRELELERGERSLEQSQFEFELSKLEAKQAAAELEAYHVHAPFSGVVRQVMKVPGESVRDGEPILELVNTDRVQVDGYGALEDMWNLQPGAQVEVWLDVPELEKFGVTKERFRGKLIHVDSLVQPVTGKVRVVAEVENRHGLLRDGLKATMQIQIRPENLAAVPLR
jgi:RND family efflux transporter MFP subunit